MSNTILGAASPDSKTDASTVAADASPEPTTHSDRIGEDGVIAGTSGKISVLRTAACDAFTLQHDHLNNMIPHCDMQRLASGTSCTQSSTTPEGYYDYTDSIAVTACINMWWTSALAKYSTFQLVGAGHTAELSLVGRITNWNNKVGDYMVVKMTGTPNENADATCEMEAGTKMELCNTADPTNWANAAIANADDNLCKCLVNGQPGPLLLLDQGAKLTSGTMEDCGRWFVGASTTATMMIGNVRSASLQLNPLLQRCVLGHTCTDTSGWASSAGQTCASYESNGWCAEGSHAPGNEWTLGAGFDYPENNCCVCGKTD